MNDIENPRQDLNLAGVFANGHLSDEEDDVPDLPETREVEALPITTELLNPAYLFELKTWIDRMDGSKTPDEVSEDAYNYLKYIKSVIQWGMDPDTRKHLDPKPARFRNGRPVSNSNALVSWIQHYLNYRDHNMAEFDPSIDPNNIQVIIAKDRATEKPIASGILRLSGDPYIELQKGDASIESIIVDPEMRGKRVGSQMVASMTETAFSMDFKRVFTWIMTPKGIEWQTNFYLFNNRGYVVASTPEDREVSFSASWLEHQKIGGAKLDNGPDALLLRVMPESYRAPNIK